MGIETERKFKVDEGLLVNCSYANSYESVKTNISQGYLVDFMHHTLRVRVTSERKALLTYKGPTKGISRTEIEFSVPLRLGKILLRMCGKVLRKTRNTFPTIENSHGLAHTKWEVDVFHNLPYPLVIAEIELPSESTAFSTPDWLMEEVSLDATYYNSNLIKEAL